jgi:hypothetical protein
VHKNFSQVFSLARGEFFRWAAVDDTPSSELVEHAVAFLDKDPALVAYVPDTANIDESGRLISRFDRTLDLREVSPVDRAMAVLTRGYQMVFHYGLMRRTTLLSTSRRWNYFGWDFILLFELALRGQLCNVEGPLFYRGVHEGSAAHCTRKVAEVRKWIDPTLHARILLPHWRWSWERLRAVLACSLSTRERIELLGLVARRVRWDRVDLKRDIVMAAKLLLRQTDEYPF